MIEEEIKKFDNRTGTLQEKGSVQKLRLGVNDNTKLIQTKTEQGQDWKDMLTRNKQGVNTNDIKLDVKI